MRAQRRAPCLKGHTSGKKLEPDLRSPDFPSSAPSHVFCYKSLLCLSFLLPEGLQHIKGKGKLSISKACCSTD